MSCRLPVRAPSFSLPFERGCLSGQETPCSPSLTSPWYGPRFTFMPIRPNSYARACPFESRSQALSKRLFRPPLAGLYPVLDPVEHTGIAYVDLPNPLRTLYPGFYLQAVITKPEADSAVFVPMKAIVFSSNTHYAIVWKGACNWEIRPLQVRKMLREGFFCDNLQPGDSVATENVLLLFQKLTQRL